MKQSPHVIVVGAGVIGLSTAWRLAAEGAVVTIVEADQPGSGTSGTSFAWANASSKIDFSAAYFTLNSLALREHHALSGSKNAEAWFHATGDIQIATDAVGLSAKVDDLKAHGYAAEMLTAAALAALEPGTVLPAQGASAFYSDEGWVDVGAFVRALIHFGTGAGVLYRTEERATEVIREGAVVRGVRLASGEELAADVVVTALGRWTTAFAVGLRVRVPLVAPEMAGSKAVGLLVHVRPVGAAPERLLHSRDINWSPLPHGRALIASDAGDAVIAEDRSPEAVRAAAEALVAQAAALNPLFAGARVEHAQIGLRALPVDGESICGWAPGISGLYIVATHSGVTLAPLLGRLVAAEVVSGTADPLLARFRLDRFAAA